MGGPAADPKWRYTDRKGHKHYATKEQYPRWPTLRWIVDRSYWCPDCRDEHDEGHWECVQCGEVIEPGMIHKGSEHKMMPGRKSFFVNDVPVSPEEFEKAVAEEKAKAES